VVEAADRAFFRAGYEAALIDLLTRLGGPAPESDES
jgi:hypothetical protein